MILDYHQAETVPAMTHAAGTTNITLVGTVTVVTATEIFTCSATHYFQIGDAIQFTNSGGGLPAPLVAGTDYYIIAGSLASTTFTISTTRGGSVLNITSTGTGTHSVHRSGTPKVAYPVGLMARWVNHVSVSRPTTGQIWPRGDDYRRIAE
jgi:hypothetical protein